MSTYNIPGFEMLRENHAGALLLKDGRTINYGVIRLEDKELVCYTGKGLREMWKPEMNAEEKTISQDLKKTAKEEGGEQKLIESSHIAIIQYNEIERVIF